MEHHPLKLLTIVRFLSVFVVLSIIPRVLRLKINLIKYPASKGLILSDKREQY
jgi:hypothetical protein